MMSRPVTIGLVPLALAMLCGCGSHRLEDELVSAAPSTVAVRSAAFAEGAQIPRKYTCDGANSSPPLAWSGVPASAKSLALICDDPDAPMGSWTHWLLFNLPPSVAELNEGLPAVEFVRVAAADGASTTAPQGKNDFGNLGYGGPCPPSGTHHYNFRLYALDLTLDLKPGASRAELIAAMKGHILAQGRSMGTYAR
jgi:Raf kinase inhibitor-like YbhB/YbcL family protein